MKLRTVGKLGVILSVILFCIGVGLYSFARLSLAESGKDADLLAVVPSDCIGLLETDNISLWSMSFHRLLMQDSLIHFKAVDFFLLWEKT